MNKQTKIPAFTMVDILTGMVITSIIISMVFYLFTSLNKQVADYGSSRNQLNSFLLLNADLKRQFNTEGEIFGIPGGFQVNHLDREITYVKDGEFFIRKTGEMRDTLTSNLESIDLLFAEDRNGNFKEEIRELSLVVNMNGLMLNSSFFKDYGLIEEINNELLHEF